MWDATKSILKENVNYYEKKHEKRTTCTIHWPRTPFGMRVEKDTIHIATKPMSEQFILGEMLALLIEENSDLHVKITKGVGGGTSNIHPAMVKGDFDLYPEYTGTGWLVILKKDTLLPLDQLFSELQKEYSREYGLKWVAPYGFNNAYSLAVSNEMAKNIT